MDTEAKEKRAAELMTLIIRVLQTTNAQEALSIAFAVGAHFGTSQARGTPEQAAAVKRLLLSAIDAGWNASLGMPT